MYILCPYSFSIHPRFIWFCKKQFKPVQNNKHFWAKLWLYQMERKLFENWMVLICKTWSPLHLRILYAKFGWNWPNGSGEEEFYIFVNVFSLFCNNLPLQKGGALHLYKLESPSLKDALCQVWLKNFWWRWKCEKYKIHVHKHKNNSHNEMSELPNLNLIRLLRLIQFYNPLYWAMMGREWRSFTMLCLIAIFVIRRLTYCGFIIVHRGSILWISWATLTHVVFVSANQISRFLSEAG